MHPAIVPKQAQHTKHLPVNILGTDSSF